MLLKRFLCWLICLRLIRAAHIEDYWSDHTLLPPTVDSINVASIPLCIHKCSIHFKCNIVAVSTNMPSSFGFICIMAWMECYERYDSRIQLAKGWDVYGIRDNGMYYKSSLSRFFLSRPNWLCQQGQTRTEASFWIGAC